MRIEHRLASSDASPHLWLGAVLCGLHYGIENQLAPSPISTGNAYAEKTDLLKQNWLDAITTFTSSDVLESYFGKDFCFVYQSIKQHEYQKYHQTIHSLEHNWYL